MLKRDLKKCPFVAVYGTLKRGHGNNRLLKSAEFLGEGLTYDKFLLYDVGFPYAVPSEEGKRLMVEVYRIPDEAVFQSLDWLEGYPSHYNRKIVKVELENGENIQAWIYYTKSPSGCECLPIRINWKGEIIQAYQWPCKEYKDREFPIW